MRILDFLPGRSSKEERFWQWFQTNEKKLFDFESDRERVFDELQTQLHKVNAGLTFEFGPNEDGVREFVISADGIKEVFPAVNALAQAAPSFDRWRIVRFRPRRESGPISFNGLTISPDQIEFTIEPDGQKVAIVIFIDGYNETDRRYVAVGYLMLDHALGEYDIETKVGGIEFRNSTEATEIVKQPFEGLVESFDSFVRTY